MRGHIVKRYKKSYTIVLNLGTDPATGKRKQQWISVKGTKKEAEKRLSDLLHQLDTYTFLRPAKTPLTEYLERWLQDYVRPNLAPRTAEGYEHIIRKYLIPALGNMTLNQLKPEHLQRYYSEKISGGLSPQTVRHHHTALHKALETAVEWGVLSRNIADAVSLPRVQRLDMQTWGEDDVTLFLEAAKSTPYHALFYTALFTGMRRFRTAGPTVAGRGLHTQSGLCEPKPTLFKGRQRRFQTHQNSQRKARHCLVTIGLYGPQGTPRKAGGAPGDDRDTANR